MYVASSSEGMAVCLGEAQDTCFSLFRRMASQLRMIAPLLPAPRNRLASLAVNYISAKKVLTPFQVTVADRTGNNKGLWNLFMSSASRWTLMVLLVSWHLLLSAAICHSEHFIQFSNSQEEKGMSISGTKDGTWVNDWTVHVPAEINMVSIGDFTPVSSPSPGSNTDGKVLAFSKGRIPVLKEHLPWETKPNTVKIAFRDPLEIELAIWVITTPEITRGGERVDYESRKKGILNFDCPLANGIWSGEAHGLSIRCSPEDRTREGDNIKFKEGGVLALVNANDYFSTTAFNCEKHANLIKNAGYKPKALNIYYVTLVDSDAEGLARAVWCDAVPDVIAIGVSSVDETLAHELGHAFTLDHINNWASPDCDSTGTNPNALCLFDEGNLMYGGGRGRQYLTEGQVFRVFFNYNSALNKIYKLGPGKTVRSGEPKRFCETIVKNEDDRNKCPTVEKRLWADGPAWPPN